MIVISAKDLTKEYGTDVILDKVSFHINEGDRVGIVGANGAGKTTLLRMLAGELPCDGGDFFISADTTLGYLKQAGDFHSDRTVMEEVESIFSHLMELERELLQITQDIAACSQGSREQENLIHRHDEMAETFKIREDTLTAGNKGHTFHGLARDLRKSVNTSAEESEPGVPMLI